MANRWLRRRTDCLLLQFLLLLGRPSRQYYVLRSVPFVAHERALWITEVLLFDAAIAFFLASDTFLLHEVLKMHIVTLKVFNQGLAFLLHFDCLFWCSDGTRIL